MILEVNNTFDERRMYFLTRDDSLTFPVPGSHPDAPRSRHILRQVWPKDFHVSPFNSREGSYALAAADPIYPLMRGTGTLASTINLKSSKGHSKLVAKLIQARRPIDPYTMTLLEKVMFLSSWWWVGFVTFPRIVKEAGALFFRRKLHVWFRPEPLKENIGRNADSTECLLEPIFRRYLRYLVEQSSSPLAVNYIPSGIPDIGELFLSPSAKEDIQTADTLDFKVLTPVFYSRFVHYAHDLEGFFCELNESSTIWVSHPELLPKFALKKPSPTLTLTNISDYAYFKAIQKLRERPERIVRPLTSSQVQEAKPTTVDIRDFRISSMDGYVLAYETQEAKTVYRSCVLNLFLADRISFGLMPLFKSQLLALQVYLAWALSPSVVRMLAKLASWAT